MSKSYTLSGTTAEEVKNARGNTTKSLESSATSGAWKKMQNWFGMLVCGGITIGLIIYVWNKLSFLGRDMYWARNKRELIFPIVAALATFGFVSSLGEGKKIKAEFYEKGFYLRFGSKSYAYEYKDIQSIKRRLYRSDPTKDSDVAMEIIIRTGEKISLSENESSELLAFSKTLLEKHTKEICEDVFEKYEKGNQITFGTFDVNNKGLLIDEELLEWENISYLKPIRGNTRTLEVRDNENEVLTTISKDWMNNEELFLAVLDEEEIPYN